MDYSLAEDLKNSGFPQDNIRRHVNVYGTVFWTRRHSVYPAYPTMSQIRREITEEIKRRYPNTHPRVPHVMTILTFSVIPDDEEGYAREYIRLTAIEPVRNQDDTCPDWLVGQRVDR